MKMWCLNPDTRRVTKWWRLLEGGIVFYHNGIEQTLRFIPKYSSIFKYFLFYGFSFQGTCTLDYARGFLEHDCYSRPSAGFDEVTLTNHQAPDQEDLAFPKRARVRDVTLSLTGLTLNRQGIDLLGPDSSVRR